MIMKRIASITLILFGFIAPLALNAQEMSEVDKLKKDLKSKDVSTVIMALKKLGNKDDTYPEAVPDIITVMNQHENSQAKYNAILALGYIKESKSAVKALKEFIAETNDRNLAYASLTALLNIGKEQMDWETNPNYEMALKLAEKRFSDDIYIKDACKRIRSFQKKNS